jgi:DNA mismatch repair ATPase MutS
LRSSILKPLIDITEIKRRLDAVEYLSDDFELLEDSGHL